eukprot:TRINITY_DN875_c0_g2_i1.p1 TRINITY_DN875_c0_g2~~TRINITY_DN875_c0_g2_i1.p1  ORF type:complete len:179 (+),score=36.48 TRINITY_DN875_c0_g2_i1:58-537(+)
MDGPVVTGEPLSLEEAETTLNDLILRLNPEDLLEFAHLLERAASETRQSAQNEDKPSTKSTSIAERKKLRQIDNIRKDLRKKVPPDGLAPNEKTILPQSFTFDGFTLTNSLHVDAFLFPDDDIIDQYCEDGLLHRDYCVKCGSREIEPLSELIFFLFLN